MNNQTTTETYAWDWKAGKAYKVAYWLPANGIYTTVVLLPDLAEKPIHDFTYFVVTLQ